MLIKHTDKEEPMTDALLSLEKRREELYRKLEHLGDFRRGSISVTYRKCGKKNCACAQEGHPGHGPLHLWSTTIKGKSYAKGVKPGPELQKYLDETNNYRSFLALCNELVEVNERICGLRPVPEIKNDAELDELKKKLQKQFMAKYKKR